MCTFGRSSSSSLPSHMENYGEICWFLVSIIDAALLSFVALTPTPSHERRNCLVVLLTVASVTNLASAFIRFQKPGHLPMINAAILFFGGSAAFISACRLRSEVQTDLYLNDQLELGLGSEIKVNPDPVEANEKR